ncbi:hypothetical protein [Streptomyces sp. MH60]|uniref:hypothetical protein n=1 Tax=Streptomyces sp. MH60 TaxID=1940758 RepID=UPI000CEDE57A|nr:hypothetical protein [Streptomyces sp. MH60]PPS89480.1 hypothetical protein BZZ08_01626 [Streptomyces sp. MH60]
MQQFGLELLILADGWAAGEDQEERLRLALVSAGRDPLEVIEREPDSDDDFDPAADEDRDFDYSAVDWQSDASADDWERMQEVLSSSRVTVSGAGRAGADAPPVPDMSDGFDREWQ